MKIGKNSIKGIFVYTPGCQPEQNDLVLYDNNIWVATSPDPTGAPSQDNPDYTLYLAPTVASEEEVMEVLRQDLSEWPDKSIPMSVLKAVLGSVFHGLSGSGIITENTGIDFDTIIKSDTVYHGIWPVARTHPDVIGLVSTSSTLKTPVFLKKYTYKIAESGITYVLLELCDYEDGMLWYKVCSDQSGQINTEKFLVQADWTLVSPSENIKYSVETLVNQYKARLSALTGIEGKLRNNFRFAKLQFPEGTVKRIGIGDYSNGISYGSETSYPRIRWGRELDYTLVVLLKSSTTGLYYTESLTIPASLGTSKIGVHFDAVGRDLIVQMTVGSEYIEFSLGGIPDSWEGSITSIYFQDFYGRTD